MKNRILTMLTAMSLTLMTGNAFAAGELHI
jgi:hypothetical protein